MDSQQETSNQPLEAVVGVFESQELATQAAASLDGPDLNVKRVSRVDGKGTEELSQIVYDDVDNVGAADTAKGMLTGGAIGAGSGLLLLGVPGLNVVAPIVGTLAGAWIGGIAGIDEANRSAELPNQEDYRTMLAEGKSFVVIAGDESSRIGYGYQLKEMGALEVHQHPPVLEMLHKPEGQKTESGT